jgi:hypothetical protein
MIEHRSATANPLVGTWRLASLELRDEAGGVLHPLGDDPAGLLTYTADGHMSGQFGRRARPGPAGDWATAPEVEIAAAAREYVAYAGTYDVRGDTVAHRVELSLLPGWVGGEQVRSVALDGDTLTLSAPAPAGDGGPRAFVLVWRRA